MRFSSIHFKKDIINLIEFYGKKQLFPNKELPYLIASFKKRDRVNWGILYNLFQIENRKKEFRKKIDLTKSSNRINTNLLLLKTLTGNPFFAKKNNFVHVHKVSIEYVKYMKYEYKISENETSYYAIIYYNYLNDYVLDYIITGFEKQVLDFFSEKKMINELFKYFPQSEKIVRSFIYENILIVE